jgi:heat shock protein HspQ
MIKTQAKYNLGQVVRHKKHPFRGVVFDIDAEFSNSEEWYDAIPEGARPARDSRSTTCSPKTTTPTTWPMCPSRT